MAGLPLTSSASRNRLLVWLLLGTLLLSTGLNLYLLFQNPEYPEDYALDAPLLETMAEVELQQTRRALAECQAGYSFTPDSLAHASAPKGQ
ncbi:hypothetical protein HMJ29_19465 [Hymenobacter taeanensis]|uniref:Uncharacterized protein n=1 Tax=Hymenobacter taeanensis TaxID=2735321 RepID=A0A6M6BMB8_9BACT|nr:MULTISPECIES: hypothetical protein [Hymenobacter]QJX48968.1 hypothetical protein HMJ29_19465 [Hymenobacter taeanensis]UOQ81517.1 hypothetical protein MUN83_01575 [Hymenobacter sp. 5414T-23]